MDDGAVDPGMAVPYDSGAEVLVEEDTPDYSDDGEGETVDMEGLAQ